MSQIEVAQQPTILEDVKEALGRYLPHVSLDGIVQEIKALQEMESYLNNIGDCFSLIDCGVSRYHYRLSHDVFLAKIDSFSLESDKLVFRLNTCFYTDEQFAPDDPHREWIPKICFEMTDRESGTAILTIFPKGRIKLKKEGVPYGYGQNISNFVDNAWHDIINICSGVKLFERLSRQKDHQNVLLIQKTIKQFAYAPEFLEDQHFSLCFKNQAEYLLQELPIKPGELPKLDVQTRTWLDAAGIIEHIAFEDRSNLIDLHFQMEFGAEGYSALLNTKNGEISALSRRISETVIILEELPDLETPPKFREKVGILDLV